MAAQKEIDLRAAINAVSDVVQNRPRPLREFDQIYMKTGDMVLQSELVARWADGKRLAFIGDGDAISVCVAYLRNREIFDYGPSKMVVFDFDERICSAIERFADNERAHIDGSTHGLVKVVADRGTGELLGGHIVGEDAGALIHEIVVLMAARTPATAVHHAIHAYPTLSESVKGALLGIHEQVG